jgi:type IV secretory pathway VirB6-like protein
LTPSVAQVPPDKIESFSVLQKKYLKTIIITNLLYAAGFGLYRGVVIPRSKEIETTVETLKLMPLSVLSGAMMYVSLPMSVVTSYKARSNYTHYYKDWPRNFTIPLLAVGIGAFVGAAGLSYWQIYSDYRDNNKIDDSYVKYNDVLYGCIDVGTITWIGTNLYSLVYIAVLGNMAEKKSPPRVSLNVAPFRIHGANGMALLCEF